jgi:hypothetical protein
MENQSNIPFVPMISKLLKAFHKWRLKGKSSFIHHHTNQYWVKNQNGFNSALYHHFGADDESSKSYTKKEVREMVSSWPKSYPCTIVIDDLTFECGRIFITVVG